MKIINSEQFQDYLRKLNIDLNSTLQRAGVNKVIWKESLELNDSEYWRLMNEMDSEFSDDVIVGFSDISRMNNFMPSFFAALSAKNGFEALDRFSKYKSLVGPVQLKIDSGAETTTISISGNALEIEPPRFTIMTEQLLIVSLLRTGTSKKILPVKVGSNYQYGQVITDTLGVTPLTEDSNEITFKNADLNSNFISTNNVMWKFIQPELDRNKLEILSDKSLNDNIQAILLKKIPSGKFDIDTISQTLNISRRTLQRNLKILDTSFSEQVKYARQTMVDPLMKDTTLDLVDISYLLGYADPESFSRAFKTWYDQSPSVYRKQLV